MAFSQLSALEARFFIVDAFITSSIGVLLNIYFLYCVRIELKRKEHNDYLRNAYQCAVVSFISSIIVYLFKAFLSNDLLIPWTQFQSNETSFVSISDSLVAVLCGIQVASNYYSFTFYSLSLLNKQIMNVSIKILMIAYVAILILCTVAVVVYDVLIHNQKEIGYFPTENFHIAMYGGQQYVHEVPWVLYVYLANGVFYSIFLLYVYIKTLRTMKGSVNIFTDDAHDPRNQGIKAIALIFVILIALCITVSLLSLQSAARFLFANIFLIVHNICLFLMFKENEKVYHKCCGHICNNLCIKIIYGTKYQSVVVETDVESNEENEQP